jgi:hypothetical protein
MPDEVAAAYSDLLSREPWHWFATLTFSPTKKITDKWTQKRVDVDRFHPLRGMHLEAADKAFRWWVFELNKRLYGGNWRRNPHGGVVWARGQEFHKSGRVHFHAVMAAPDGDLNRLASRYHWHELWYREFGRNQIEYPRSQDDVLGYVSKYVTKGGEVDFSQNFGKAQPPPMFDGWQDRMAGIHARPPALADDRSRRGDGQQGTPRGEALSLTLPVRLQETQQAIFTEESFFEPTTR